MLVLSRKLGESIMIGDDITIMVVEIRKKDRVRIGITAPKDVAVNRLEVWQAIQRQKEIEQEGKE